VAFIDHCIHRTIFKETSMYTKLVIAAASLALMAGTVMAAPAGVTKSENGILVDGEGMTLYVFDKDQPGTSNCNDQCAVMWPPMVAKPDAKADGDFTTIDRKDGSRQWAYKSRPLYYWFGDAEPGDSVGDGIDGVWHAVE
jgi:predicted lipoprotein with Yx(FWY)xxD motif